MYSDFLSFSIYPENYSKNVLYKNFILKHLYLIIIKEKRIFEKSVKKIIFPKFYSYN